MNATLTYPMTIISGASRTGSNTLRIARFYQQFLAEHAGPVKLLDLTRHAVHNRDAAFLDMEQEYLIPARRFIFISPEYNGSYSGVLKCLIDHSDVKACWHHKKALLTGVATGRAGNLRGMEHLTGSLMHMKMHVHPHRLPISRVDQLLNDEGELTDVATRRSIQTQLEEFLMD